MRDPAGLQLRKKARSFIVFLITCAVLVLACLISDFEPSPFDAWANSSSGYETEQQPPEEKQSTESGVAASAESGETSPATTQPAPSESEQIAPFGEQIGPWYAIQDKTVDELIDAIDGRPLLESPRTHPAAPLILGIFSAVVLAAVLAAKAKRE